MTRRVATAPFALAAECLRARGSPGFADPFLALARHAGADQVMAFDYGDEGVRCLLSRNFVEGPLGARLAEEYLAHGHVADPLRRRLDALAPGGLSLHRMDEVLDEMPADYRARFFAAPRLGDKVTALVAGRRRLAVSLYWRGAARVDEGLVALLARLLEIHAEALPESAVPPPLAALSPRERATCLGALSGRKTEQIAHDLGVRPSSVATYRARAYAKLGINSRAALFALCRPPPRPPFPPGSAGSA